MGPSSNAFQALTQGVVSEGGASFTEASFRHPRTPDRRTHRCKFNTTHSHIKRIRQLFHGPDLRAQPLTPPPALRPAPRRSRSNTTRNSTLAPTVLGYSLPGATQLSQTTLHQIALHRAQSRSLEVHTKSNDQRAASAPPCAAARGTHARAVCHSSHMSETVTTC